jgi:hypothetical protein
MGGNFPPGISRPTSRGDWKGNFPLGISRSNSQRELSTGNFPLKSRQKEAGISLFREIMRRNEAPVLFFLSRLD